MMYRYHREDGRVTLKWILKKRVVKM